MRCFCLCWIAVIYLGQKCDGAVVDGFLFVLSFCWWGVKGKGCEEWECWTDRNSVGREKTTNKKDEIRLGLAECYQFVFVSRKKQQMEIGWERGKRYGQTEIGWDKVREKWKEWERGWKKTGLVGLTRSEKSGRSESSPKPKGKISVFCLFRFNFRFLRWNSDPYLPNFHI